MTGVKTNDVTVLLVRDGDVNSPTTTHQVFNYRDIFALCDILRSMHDDDSISYVVLEPVTLTQLELFP